MHNLQVDLPMEVWGAGAGLELDGSVYGIGSAKDATLRGRIAAEAVLTWPRSTWSIVFGTLRTHPDAQQPGQHDPYCDSEALNHCQRISGQDAAPDTVLRKVDIDVLVVCMRLRLQTGVVRSDPSGSICIARNLRVMSVPPRQSQHQSRMTLAGRDREKERLSIHDARSEENVSDVASYFLGSRHLLAHVVEVFQELLLNRRETNCEGKLSGVPVDLHALPRR